MTDTVAPTSAPPWARKMWFDTEHIYMEMPVIGSHPITLKEKWTEGGLSKMLKLMRRVAEESVNYVPRNGKTVLDHPIIKRPKEQVQSTVEGRSKARELLKRKGII